MDRIERNNLLLDIAYALFDLIEENHMLAEKCKELSNYRDSNEKTNREILKHQNEAIGSILKHLIHKDDEVVEENV